MTILIKPIRLLAFLLIPVILLPTYSNAAELAYSGLAKITLIVTTKTKTLASAMKQNNDLRDSVTQQLIKSGVSSDDIQSSKYSASPQFGWFGKSPSSFEVEQSD